MDAELVKTLLESIKMAISTNRRQDDMALPAFDPEKMHNGAESWCKNIEDLGAELNWSSLQMVAKAGKALRGSAFSWFESWEPEHRDWETFRQDLVALFPTKKNLTEKLTKAVLYNSESAETYAEYAREKILLLKKTKVSFTEEQLVELVCGGVRDVNVRMASFNSSVNTTNELITLFSSYSKNPRKRPFDKNATVDDSGTSTAKKPRTDFATKHCFTCGQKGHIQFQCPKNSNNNKNGSDSEARPKSKVIPTTSNKNLKCEYCKKEGHSIEKCWTKQRVDREKQNNKPVNCMTQSGLKLTKVYINDIAVDALIDTGANCSIIKESIAFRLGCHVSPWAVRLDGIGSGHVNTFGKITVPVHFNDVCIELDLNVVSNDFVYDCIIGQDVVKYADIAIITDTSGTKLVRKNIVNLSKNNLENNQNLLSESVQNLDKKLQDKIITIFDKYPRILPTEDYIGNVNTGKLEIKLKTDKNINYRPYRLAPLEREKVKNIVSDLLRTGIIRDSDSSYASPVLLVKKRDGGDRMCVDYRALNSIIEKERYPLPLIQDEIDQLGKAKYFISIDMKNGFHQIPVSENSIKYTAFVTPDGHYEYIKMPFGICNGPSVFQRAISKAVKDLKFVRVYIDDLLLPCETIEQGLEYLDLCLAALVKAGFTINLKKCRFFVTSIEYLGWIISAEGVRPSETKVKALVNSPIPKTVKQVRQFMGLASYFRKFIPEFASKTACITKLTKNGQNWEWGDEQNAARQYIIDKLTSEPILSIFDPSLPTELHTDASSIGYGGMLVQKHGTNNRVVAYFSRRTTEPESKYTSYELETLAVYNSLKVFRVYLLGISFKIVTDCNAIKSTMYKKDLSPRVARWWTYMQDFNFEVVYKKGIYVGHVDYLSRNPATSTASKLKFSEAPLNINLLTEHSSWLEVAQHKDPETLSLIDRVQNGDIGNDQYVFKNNLLYYKCPIDNKLKAYVPKGSRLGILRLYHDENCHVGQEKTLQKIRESFWFPGINRFVRKYISHCLVCVKGKFHSGPHQGLLHPIDKTPIPFHTVHLDCTGPFTQSSEGYKHIIIIIDAFTKYCILKPLKTMSGEEMSIVIRDALTMFGIPSKVITDRATNFSNVTLTDLFREWNVDHHMISTGTPRSNGQVERYVATIINMLTTICNNETEWPNSLYKVQQTLNTTIQKTTGFSPLRLLTGRDSNIPSVQARLADIEEPGPSNVNQIIDVRADRVLAYNKMKSAADKYKSRFDTKRRDNINYAIGDIVYVCQDHRRHSKLSPKFKGPYEIIEILQNDRYRLRGQGRLHNIVIAKEKLRKWQGEWSEENQTAEQGMIFFIYF